jgi:hypothetical protein
MNSQQELRQLYAQVCQQPDGLHADDPARETTGTGSSSPLLDELTIEVELFATYICGYASRALNGSPPDREQLVREASAARTLHDRVSALSVGDSTLLVAEAAQRSLSLLDDLRRLAELTLKELQVRESDTRGE